jgi:hypothetical protein
MNISKESGGRASGVWRLETLVGSGDYQDCNEYVKVVLKCDNEDRPTHFQCRRGSSESSTADLSHEALVKAIKQLYPPGSY